MQQNICLNQTTHDHSKVQNRPNKILLVINKNMFQATEYISHKQETSVIDNLSRVMRKPVFGVSDQVRHKSPGCTATEDG